MRDVPLNILDTFEKFGLADLRVGQTIFNFCAWHQKKYGSDVFYIENDVFAERFEEYYNETINKS